MPEETVGQEPEQNEHRSYEECRADYEAQSQIIAEALAAFETLGVEDPFTEEFAELANNNIAEAYDIVLGNITTLSPDERDKTTEIVGRIKESHTALIEIGKELLPKAASTLAERRQQFVDTTDWDGLIEHMAQDNADSGVDHAVELIGRPDRYKDSVDGVLWELDVITNAMQEEQVARFKVEPSPDAIEVDMGCGDLSGAITRWSELTDEALNYVSPARYIALKEKLPAADLQRLAALAHRAGLNGDKDVALPGKIIDAFEKAAAKRMQAFDNADRDQLAEIRAGRPNMLTVTNPDLLEKTTTIPHVPNWFNELSNEWPDWMTQGVGFVQIVESIPDDEPHTPEDPRDKLTTSGQWTQNENSLTLSAHIDDFEKTVEKLQEDGSDETEARQRAKRTVTKMVNQIAVHELMHNAHGNQLPISWLREWQAEVMQSRDTYVTEYVEEIRKKDSVRQADREDLCDTTAEYRYQPAHLMLVSPGRFMKMQSLFHGYSEGRARALYAALQKNPTPDDEFIFTLNLAMIDTFNANPGPRMNLDVV